MAQLICVIWPLNTSFCCTSWKTFLAVSALVSGGNPLATARGTFLRPHYLLSVSRASSARVCLQIFVFTHLIFHSSPLHLVSLSHFRPASDPLFHLGYRFLTSCRSPLWDMFLVVVSISFSVLAFVEFWCVARLAWPAARSPDESFLHTRVCRLGFICYWGVVLGAR